MPDSTERLFASLRHSRDAFITTSQTGGQVKVAFYFKGDNVPATLCKGCKYSIIAENANGDVRVRCSMLDAVLRRPIIYCSEFTDKRAMTLHEMKASAYLIVPKKGGGIGFASPRERTIEMHRELNDMDGD